MTKIIVLEGNVTVDDEGERRIHVPLTPEKRAYYERRLAQLRNEEEQAKTFWEELETGENG